MFFRYPLPVRLSLRSVDRGSDQEIPPVAWRRPSGECSRVWRDEPCYLIADVWQSQRNAISWSSEVQTRYCHLWRLRCCYAPRAVRRKANINRRCRLHVSRWAFSKIHLGCIQEISEFTKRMITRRRARNYGWVEQNYIGHVQYQTVVALQS